MLKQKVEGLGDSSVGKSAYLVSIKSRHLPHVCRHTPASTHSEQQIPKLINSKIKATFSSYLEKKENRMWWAAEVCNPSPGEEVSVGSVGPAGQPFLLSLRATGSERAMGKG